MAAITISFSRPMPIIWIMREQAPEAGSTPILSGRSSKPMVVNVSDCARKPAGKPSLVILAVLTRELLR